jgi:hypothetical protein
LEKESLNGNCFLKLFLLTSLYHLVVWSVVIYPIHAALGKQPFNGPNILHTLLLVLIAFLKVKVLVTHLPMPIPPFPTLNLFFYSKPQGSRFLQNIPEDS